jgi:hypothetical protein
MPRHFKLVSLLMLSVCVVALLSATEAKAQTPQLAMADRVRINEAFHLNDQLSDRVWPGWRKTPFAVLLLTDDYEFLLGHPQPPADFTAAGNDPLLKTKVYYRKRTMPPNLQATFPIGGTPTVVIGQAENTQSKTSTRWVVTLMHEHFHQLQYSQPDYQESTLGLKLTRGDQSGMWMLNYAFPYKSEEVNKAYGAMCERLAVALDDKQAMPLAERVSAYLDARDQFRQAISEDDYKYFGFQLWQEGIARYTEYRIAALAASHYRPTAAFRALKDFTPYSDVATKMRARIQAEIEKPALSEHEREVVYGFGAAEALLLDRARRDWRRRYFAEKLQTASFFRDK